MGARGFVRLCSANLVSKPFSAHGVALISAVGPKFWCIESHGISDKSFRKQLAQFFVVAMRKVV
jgi:hypothetical protein